MRRCDVAYKFTFTKEGKSNFAKIAGRSDAPFLVGIDTVYQRTKHGLFNRPVAGEILYDPAAYAGEFGFWAFFIAPTAKAESKNSFACINTYDRAQFTFGFMQYAAHVPNGDFVRFFKELLKLPAAKDYFPKLSLKDGRIHFREDNGSQTQLESDESTQKLMDYLNPSLSEIDNQELVCAARMIHWSQNDPKHRELQVKTAVDHFRDNLKLYDKRYELDGMSADICFVICDIHHQGRAKIKDVKTALDTNGDRKAALKNLLKLGEADYKERVETISAELKRLSGSGFFEKVYRSALNDFTAPGDPAPEEVLPINIAGGKTTLQKIAANNIQFKLNDLALDRDLAGEIQNRLIALGCLDPPADGDFGTISRFVLTEFCKLSRIDFDTTITPQIAKTLLNNSSDTFLPLKLSGDLASKIVRYMQFRNYWIAKLPGFLNIVYLEGADADGTPNADKFNEFNDRRIVFAVENGKPVILYNALGSTEPGRYYTERPLNSLGAARIAFGQYKAWRVGVHNAGKRTAHEALIQADKITVHRDLNKDGMRTGDRLDVGSGFFVNQHSGFDAPVNNIGRSSAGCLVSRSSADHKEFMKLVKTDPRFKKASNGYKFITTVIAGDDLKKQIG